MSYRHKKNLMNVLLKSKNSVIFMKNWNFWTLKGKSKVLIHISEA